jgi:putative heme iron utilization protein
VTLANPFAGKAEASMIEHMNSDHANAIAHYALTGLPQHAPAQMVGIDSEGMHLRIGQAVYWLPSRALQHADTSPRSLGLLAPTSGRFRQVEG